MALILVKTPLMHFSKALARLRHVQFTQKDLDKFDIAKKSTKVHYLNQSYLFHLVALWETFIEDLALYGFGKLTETANSGVAKPVIESDIKHFVKRMHSPKWKNIDEFFWDTLEIKDISKVWEWDGMSRGDARGYLTTIMDARNQIGHTSFTKHELSFDKNFEYMMHLYNLAFLTENAVERYVAEKLGEEVPPINNKIRYPENLGNEKDASKKKGK